MTKETTVQMEDHTFNGKDLLSIITFPQDFKAAYEVFNIHEGAPMWLFNHHLAGSVISVIK